MDNKLYDIFLHACSYVVLQSMIFSANSKYNYREYTCCKHNTCTYVCYMSSPEIPY